MFTKSERYPILEDTEDIEQDIDHDQDEQSSRGKTPAWRKTHGGAFPSSSTAVSEFLRISPLVLASLVLNIVLVFLCTFLLLRRDISGSRLPPWPSTIYCESRDMSTQTRGSHANFTIQRLPMKL